MILQLIIVLGFLQVNSIRGLRQNESSSTVNWSECVCPSGNKSCLNYFGESREDYISCLPSLNESCGSDSTTAFRTCQPPFRCDLLENQNKYQCQCDGCGRNNTSWSKNIVTESIGVFINFLKWGMQCGGNDYRDETRYKNDLCEGAPGYKTTTTTAATTTKTTTTKTTTTKTTIAPSGLLKLEEKCGGINYQGKTECEPTFKCTAIGPFLSLCKCPNRSSWCPGAPGYPTTTTKPPTTVSLATTPTPQAACNFCGVFTSFANVCQNCNFTRDHCLLTCTCRTSSCVTQPMSFSLSSAKNQGCLIGMQNAKSYNQPNISLCALWSSDATTLANENVVGLQPAGIYIDTENTIYVADRQNGRIMVWDKESSIPTRNISDNFINPWSLFVTTDATIYVDNGDFNNRVDQWIFNASNSAPVMNVGGSCTGLSIDGINNTLYCSLASEHLIVKVELNSSTMAPIIAVGTGCPGSVSDMLDHPHGIFVDTNSYLYVADTDNNRIQRFAPGQLSGTTLAGFGATVYFILNRPTDVVLDADGYLFIVESHNHRIIRTVENGFKCVVGCFGGSGTTSSQLHNPQTMAFDSNGNIFVTDMSNHRVQKFTLVVNTCATTSTTVTTSTSTTTVTTTTTSTSTTTVTTTTTSTSTTTVTTTIIPLRAPAIEIPPNAKWQQNGVTVAGGNGSGSGFNQLIQPLGLYVDDAQTVYVADRNNHRIVGWKWNATSGEVVAGGNGEGNGTHQLFNPFDVIVDKERDSFIICDWRNRRVVRWLRRNGIHGETTISNIDCFGLTMDDIGSVYVADMKKHEVRRFQRGDSQGTVVAGGNGDGNHDDQLSSPQYVFVDRDYSVYVSDFGNHRVMKWVEDAKEGVVVAGGQGQGNNFTQLSNPQGVVVDKMGTVYVADAENYRIMRWVKEATEGNVIVGGNGRAELLNELNYPFGLSFDLYGNLYVVEWGNNRVQKFNIEQTIK
ncbi:unnamed protein product [Rotaria socialis]